MEWQEYFLEMAEFVSRKSKDRSTKVGCVIVGPNHEVRTTGYNGFCRGIDDNMDYRHDRPEKYFWAEHAERNAIYNAARNGIRLEDCTLYSTVFPCADCARAIIQSGIKTVVSPEYKNETRISSDSYERSKMMFNETGVEVVQCEIKG
jgi:dCMP deaminase